MHKDKVVASMIEVTNICLRHFTVQGNGNLIELEKKILQDEPMYKYIYSFAYDRLVQQGLIVPPVE